MNCGSEWQTLRAVEVGFNAACATPWRSIEMDANKNRVAIRIRDGDARSQRNKDVAISRHHHAIAVRLQHRFQTLRDIEVHCLLIHALARRAESFGAVSRVACVTGVSIMPPAIFTTPSSECTSFGPSWFRQSLRA